MTLTELDRRITEITAVIESVPLSSHITEHAKTQLTTLIALLNAYATLRQSLIKRSLITKE